MGALLYPRGHSSSMPKVIDDTMHNICTTHSPLLLSPAAPEKAATVLELRPTLLSFVRSWLFGSATLRRPEN